MSTSDFTLKMLFPKEYNSISVLLLDFTSEHPASNNHMLHFPLCG